LKIIDKIFDNVLLIKLEPISDERGYFMRTFDADVFKSLGINENWVQENHTYNKLKGTIRGLHFLLPPYTDGKMVKCSKGSINDVILDLRKDSKYFGKWKRVVLNSNDFCWLYIPKGFAHGYCTLEDNTEIIYRHDSFYKKESDSGIRWNDKDINIEWNITNPIVSVKDNNLMTFKDFKDKVGGL
jgi:dTDP-4-dehydrorhamnose 3,5-epimerase